MADQCIVCLENLDSTIPLQQLQASPTASSTTTNITTTIVTTKHLSGTDESRLDPDDNIAVIQVCGHILHDSCLKAWTGKANSCPICRQAFHLVEVYDKVGGALLNTYTVEDKKQVAEFDPLAWLDENPEEEEEESRPCPVCNTADHEDVLLLCDGCNTPYHTHCIGLDDVPDGAWFCMECADQNEITVQEFQAVAARTAGRVRRRRNFFPRTQASMRNERTRARTDQWLGAWGQFSSHVHGATGIDLDSHDDEDDHLRAYRRSQAARERERRDWQRWQQRLSIASRLGARDVFARNIQGVVEQQVAPPSGSGTPGAPETREERQAWRDFERARASTPSSRKRKSRSITASPVEPAPEPSRPLKRPRTRRITNQGGEAVSSKVASTASNHHVDARSRGSSNDRSPLAQSPAAPEEAPSFLSSLLKEVEQSGPADDETVRGLFGLPPTVDPSSPVASPSASARNSPRALSLTPPPAPPPANATARSASRSPVLSLSSHIEPKYPPANYSPTRSNGESSDSENRPLKRNGSPELRQPRPRRQLEVRLSQSQELSPTRKTLPLEIKEDISQVVRAALKPHWKSSQLSRDQYEKINRAVSHKIYEEVSDPSTVNEEAKRQWEKIATTEVAHAVAELKS
ncbi:hypothetical protein M406DRAFT_245288 [Cryphonectria parasitica EP155]|uniref:PHD and RING finger domain-containing protein n=1 Tax=Cryphonectria parasitica (strain ATCC 38755 / EP155) TaxID=660469 RepID=A0A9P5CUL4_CRYP1|nr:uncharacterized protein M406DRAFT_245288 [Cryphonectria parasitica EP155]KAF3770150.1 hypothetical protein M406DRAFT_245288 [Cryphonectria parasitica EP155]